MRKTGVLLTLFVVSILAQGAVLAAGESSASPPTDLKMVGDHWTAWDPPPAGADAYIIVKGDTLWDLAEQWLGDPFLWPQIWDENRYILDSHWIYPGDPLVVPGRPTVVPEDGPPAIAEVPDTPDEVEQVVDSGEVEHEMRPLPAPLVPVADTSDMYCSGYIDPEHKFSDLWVAGHEMEGDALGEGDVIYLSQGRNQGLKAGDELAVRRRTNVVLHPTTDQPLGHLVRRLGKARVMVVQDNSASAMIQFSCEDIRASDELVEWQEIPIPRRRSMPDFDRYGSEASGGPDGTVVVVGFDQQVAGEGQVIQTDLGVASGVRPGDVLTVYRANGELPRMMLGQAVVLTVEPLTSTVKLTKTVRETWVGDHVEVIQ